ncbi:nucleotide disphospho-sugar-binding domain-containing protein, partial [Streptomyces sp. NPDC004232]|uniref:glycosyltransferase n=1 Tax=Streptomyces sp. NPDC004232 TaxID=3154454 RepID=UPI0033B22706
LLLPTCHALIHQGGAGTTMTAMTHATPQLILPWAPDAVINAQQVAKTGAGHHLPPNDLDDTTLQTTLNSFLQNLPDHREAAALLHTQHLDMPTPADIASDIDQLIPKNVQTRHCQPMPDHSEQRVADCVPGAALRYVP